MKVSSFQRCPIMEVSRLWRYNYIDLDLNGVEIPGSIRGVFIGGPTVNTHSNALLK